MTKVVILCGGKSNERDVSLRSGKAVRAALIKSGIDVKIIDPINELADYLVGLKTADVVFIALHGKGGEDGQCQLFLEKNGIKFVGSDSQASRLCFNKFDYYNLLKANNILQPVSQLIDYTSYLTSDMAKSPHVLKPNQGGSSIDTFINRQTDKKVQSAIELAFKKYDKLLLQNLINGVELTVGVLGESALPVIEIIPPKDKEFDYANKYNGESQELCPPLHIDSTLQKVAQNLSLKIHKMCQLRDMSRSDFILAPDNKLYVLETNTIPGLTDQSLLPKAAHAVGIDMSALSTQLIDMAMNR